VSIFQAQRRWDELYSKVAGAGRTCYICNYTSNPANCMYPYRDAPQICYREYGIPNYMATNALCDYTPAPTRTIINVSLGASHSFSTRTLGVSSYLKFLFKPRLDGGVGTRN